MQQAQHKDFLRVYCHFPVFYFLHLPVKQALRKYCNLLLVSTRLLIHIHIYKNI